MIFNLFEQTDQFNNSTDVESVLENAFKNADPADFASFDKFDDVEFEKVEAEKVEAVKDEAVKDEVIKKCRFQLIRVQQLRLQLKPPRPLKSLRQLKLG